MATITATASTYSSEVPGPLVYGSEALLLMRSELCMFALAGVVYLLVSSSRRGVRTRTAEAPRPRCAASEKPQGVGSAADRKPSLGPQAAAHAVCHRAKTVRRPGPREACFASKDTSAIIEGCVATRDLALAEQTFEAAHATARLHLCTGLMRVYLACDSPDKALCLYEQVVVPARLGIDSTLFEALFKAALSRGRSDIVASLGNAAANDVALSAKLIKEYGREGKLEAAAEVLARAKERGAVKPLVYNSMLEACVRCSDLAAARSYLDEAASAGCVDVVSYNTVTKGCLASGDAAGAQAVLAEMAYHGVVANQVTYHGLLSACASVGDRRGAWDVVERMRANGFALTPVACSIILKLVTKRQHATDLERVSELIIDASVQTDEVLLAHLTEASLRVGRLDVLSRHLNDSGVDGALRKLPSPMYGSIIKAFGQARDVDQVWLTWKEMRRCEVQPSAITLGCMVEALVACGSADGAWQLIQDVWEDEAQRPLLNTVTYTTILKGFAMSKDMDKVLALYDEMKSRGYESNVITFNTMLNALVRCGKLDRMPQLLEDMRNAKPPVEPDMVTYSTIMKGYCSSGDLDRGLALLEEVEASGLVPDEVVFNSLLDGCAKQQRLDDALRLLGKMRTRDVVPSNFTLSIMIKLLGRARRLKKAFALVGDITAKHNFRPNIHVYTCLVQACFQNGQPDRALALHDEIVAEGCVFDQRAYAALAQGCVQAGAFAKAVEVLRCACGLPGHSLRRTEGCAPHFEPKSFDAVLAKLRASGGAGARAAQQLVADFEDSQHRGQRRERPCATPPAPTLCRKNAGPPSIASDTTRPPSPGSESDSGSRGASSDGMDLERSGVTPTIARRPPSPARTTSHRLARRSA